MLILLHLESFFTAPYALKSNLKDLFRELAQYTTNTAETNKNMLTQQELDKLSDEYDQKTTGIDISLIN